MRNICCFAGHRDTYLNDDISKQIDDKIEDLICNYHANEFWVGNYGSFDRHAALAVLKLKKKYPNISLNLVVPYITKTTEKYMDTYKREFDYIIIAEIPQNTPKPYQILKCNRYMVDNSKYIICHVKHGWGGAAQTLEYAQKKESYTSI